MTKSKTPALTSAELATVLAALRLLQSTDGLPPDIYDIASDGATIPPLDGAAIDDLCLRLNISSTHPEPPPGRWYNVIGNVYLVNGFDLRVHAPDENTARNMAKQKVEAGAITRLREDSEINEICINECYPVNAESEETPLDTPSLADHPMAIAHAIEMDID